MYVVRNGKSYEVSYLLRNSKGSFICGNCSSSVDADIIRARCPFCHILLMTVNMPAQAKP